MCGTSGSLGKVVGSFVASTIGIVVMMKCYLHKATPSDTLVSGPPPASDFILGFLSHYWISIPLFLLRMRIMVHVIENSVIIIFICKIMRFIR